MNKFFPCTLNLRRSSPRPPRSSFLSHAIYSHPFCLLAMLATLTTIARSLRSSFTPSRPPPSPSSHRLPFPHHSLHFCVCTLLCSNSTIHLAPLLTPSAKLRIPTPPPPMHFTHPFLLRFPIPSFPHFISFLESCDPVAPFSLQPFRRYIGISFAIISLYLGLSSLSVSLTPSIALSYRPSRTLSSGLQTSPPIFFCFFVTCLFTR